MAERTLVMPAIGASLWTQRAKSVALSQWKRVRDYAIALFIVGTVAIILAPMSAIVMDLLLSFNLTLGLLLLLTSVFVSKPLEFSTFPSVLLVVTLYRLALNIATTRLILAEGHKGPHAAGDIIATFGSFVAGGSDSGTGGIVIGLTIFAIITIIQFIVITKGATRIAEVAARFTLDAMPGKQMAIDAALNSGSIKEEEAEKQRLEIQQLTDFYGSMDGASKFVRGDAIASIIITIVNIAVGFIMGMLIYGKTAGDAAITYTMLTIGDGLVSQIPALLISIGSGLLVTRSSMKVQFGKEITGQIFGQAKALGVATLLLCAAGFLGLFGFPFPAVPLLIVGLGCGVAWYSLRKTEDTDKVQKETAAAQAALAEPKPETDKVEDLLKIDPMRMEVGYRVVALVDAQQGGGGLLVRVGHIRTQLAQELGIIVPRIRIVDNINLDPNEYMVKIHNEIAARANVEADKLMAMDAGTATGAISGIRTIEPSFGMPAYWIDPAAREYAERMGYTVVDAETVVITHLTEIIKSHAADLLNREETRRLLDAAKEYAPNAVQEAEAQGALTLTEIQKVLQNLLKERISIRNLPLILETLTDIGRRVKDPDTLTEYARMALSRWICNEYAQNGKLHVVSFDPATEDQLIAKLERTETGGAFLVLRPQAAQRLIEAIARSVQQQMQMGHPALIMTAPQLRRSIRMLTASSMPHLSVMSQNEVISEMAMESSGLIQCDLG